MHVHLCTNCSKDFVCAESIIDCRTVSFTCLDCSWSVVFRFARLVVIACLIVFGLVLLFG